MNLNDLIVAIATLSSVLIVTLSLTNKHLPSLISSLRQTLTQEVQAAIATPPPVVQTTTPAQPTPVSKPLQSQTTSSQSQINSGLVPPPAI